MRYYHTSGGQAPKFALPSYNNKTTKFDTNTQQSFFVRSYQTPNSTTWFVILVPVLNICCTPQQQQWSTTVVPSHALWTLRYEYPTWVLPDHFRAYDIIRRRRSKQTATDDQKYPRADEVSDSGLQSVGARMGTGNYQPRCRRKQESGGLRGCKNSHHCITAGNR